MMLGGSWGFEEKDESSGSWVRPSQRTELGLELIADLGDLVAHLLGCDEAGDSPDFLGLRMGDDRCDETLRRLAVRLSVTAPTG